MMQWEYLPEQSQCSACVKDAVAKKKNRMRYNVNEINKPAAE